MRVCDLEIANDVRRVNEQKEEAKLPMASLYESRNGSEACLGELAGLEDKLEVNEGIVTLFGNSGIFARGLHSRNTVLSGDTMHPS